MQVSLAMLGKILDQRYKIIQELAAGGFSQTYLAEDTRLPGHPRCVVKHLNPTISEPIFLQKALELFNAEAETLQNLGTHDQIPRLYAYFEENNEFYLVQEFIEGHPLSKELLPGGKLPEARVAKLVQDVLHILKYVHTCGVIHRDIKPNNLIRRYSDGKLVLIDFGTVKQVHTQIINSHARSQVTMPIGTPGYMSSEQEQGNSCPNSDIYALGMVALQGLTGMHPSQFPRANNGEVMWRSHAKVSKEMGTILDKMVSYEPTQRYQNVDEVLRDLEKLPHASSHQQSALEAETIAEKISKQFTAAQFWQIVMSVGVVAIAVMSIISIVKASSVPTDSTSNSSSSSPNPSLKPVSSPSPPKVAVAINLEVKYDRLQSYLSQKNWQAADAETYNLMLKLAGEQSYMDGTYHPNELENYSTCTGIVLIDRLWSNASQGRLGFTAQKKVFEAEGKEWQKMYAKVGWRSLTGEWLVNTRYNRSYKRWEYQEGYTPSFQNPPVGHLPVGIREIGQQSLGKNALLQRCL